MPPQKDAKLDLVLTNMHEFYISPLAFPPFGPSEHSTVVASSTSQKVNTNTNIVVTKHDQGPSLKVAMERYENSIDCPLLFASLGSWEDKWAVFSKLSSPELIF